MGVFQSVGGAATSGKGLNDAHIRAAIITALDTTANLSNERRVKYADALRVGQKKASEVIESEDYLLEQKGSFTVPVAGNNSPTDGDVDELEVVEYAPDVFCALRRLGGTNDSEFSNEWRRAPPMANTNADAQVASEGQGMELGEGRSGALFLKSKSMAYMCKTISETEVHVLVGLLKKYLAFLEENPDSLLMRFVMMLRVTLKGEAGYILCFADCFSNCDVLHERWDLKGRRPKPGKFRHFPKHSLTQNTVNSDKKVDNQSRDDGDSSTDSEWEAEKARRKASGASKNNLRTADSRQALKLLTFKDKNLARLFWLEPHTRCDLIAQIKRDFQFLNDCGLMDYSILIGVRYNTPEQTLQKELERDRKLVARSGQGSASPSVAMRQTFAMGEESNAGAVEMRAGGGSPLEGDSTGSQFNSTQSFLSRMNQKISMFHRGVENLECGETYYIGIIDMLTVYNAKKKTANFCKSFLWRENTLSTIPPNAYRARIELYAHQIFPLVSVMENGTNVTTSASPTKGKHDNMVRLNAATSAVSSAINRGRSSNNLKLNLAATASARNPTAPNTARAPQTSRGDGAADDEEAFLFATQYPDSADGDAEAGEINVEPSALHMAAEAGNVDTIKDLIKHQMNANAKDENGKTPLINATQKSNYSAVKALIDAKVEISPADKLGRTPLHYAAIDGNLKITKALIEAGADLDAQDRIGCTALHHAVENFNHKIIQALITANCNLNLLEEEGMTPLQCAVDNEDAVAIQILKEAGALERSS